MVKKLFKPFLIVFFLYVAVQILFSKVTRFGRPYLELKDEYRSNSSYFIRGTITDGVRLGGIVYLLTFDVDSFSTTNFRPSRDEGRFSRDFVGVFYPNSNKAFLLVSNCFWKIDDMKSMLPMEIRVDSNLGRVSFAMHDTITSTDLRCHPVYIDKLLSLENKESIRF